jgi:16S rRNA processing protein RimM
MGRTDPTFLVVGHVRKPHGIKGEVFVSSLTDHPDGTFVDGVVVTLDDADSETPSTAAPALSIASAHPHKDGYLVRFVGVETRSAAEALQGRYLHRPVEELEPLAEGEVFYHQLLGMAVETTDGARLGEVVEVYELTPSDMLDVRGAGKEHMIPFREGVVIEVDHHRRRLVIDPPEGLLDL